MAREFMDGFETGDFSLWDSVGSGAVIASAASYGMQGAKCGQLYNGYFTKNVTARDSYYLAFKLRTNYVEAMTVLNLYNGATVLGTLKLTAGGNLTLNSGTTTLLATGTKVITANTSYLIEVYYKPATDGSGVFTAKVDGGEDVTFAGANSAAALQINKFAIGGSQTQFIDDVIVDASSWVGPTKIQALIPNGNGLLTQFMSSTAGNDYTCVDEVPPSDTDYVYTNTPNNIDTYALPNLTGNIGEVKSVQVTARACYQGTAAVTQLKAVLRDVNIVQYNLSSGTAVLSTSFQSFGFIWELNPNTSLPWTELDISALEAGIKAI